MYASRTVKKILGEARVPPAGISAPKNTPIEIINTLNREINAGLGDPRTRDRIIDLGSVPLSLTATEFGKLIADETEKWAKVIRAANIKL